jgi:two-component system, chemotaxis family, chemotaxis protein CheY
MKALVVDDSRAMRNIVKSYLTELGYSCLEAANGMEAIAILQKSGPVEVGMFDWNMPVMNGYELVQAVRANAAYSGMKILMVTTETEMTQVEKALVAGANEYIMKPFTRDVVRDKLALIGLDSEAA